MRRSAGQNISYRGDLNPNSGNINMLMMVNSGDEGDCIGKWKMEKEFRIFLKMEIVSWILFLGILEEDDEINSYLRWKNAVKYKT